MYGCDIVGTWAHALEDRNLIYYFFIVLCCNLAESNSSIYTPSIPCSIII